MLWVKFILTNNIPLIMHVKSTGQHTEHINLICFHLLQTNHYSTQVSPAERKTHSHSSHKHLQITQHKCNSSPTQVQNGDGKQRTYRRWRGSDGGRWWTGRRAAARRAASAVLRSHFSVLVLALVLAGHTNTIGFSFGFNNCATEAEAEAEA